MISQFKSSQEEFTSIVKDLKPIVFDESQNIEMRVEKLSQLKESVRKILYSTHLLLINDVAGGIKRCIFVFFTKGGLYSVNSSDQHYTDLLNLFKTLDQLVEMCSDSLDDLEKLLLECKEKLAETEQEEKFLTWLEEKGINKTVQKYHSSLDEVATELEKVRERNDMDYRIA